MPRLLRLALLLIAVERTPADEVRYALGISHPGRLTVYSVTPSGEIAQHDQASGVNSAGRILQDAAGRFTLTLIGPHDLDLHRIRPNRTLSLASSYEAGPSINPLGGLAISQDSRVALARFRDSSVNPAQVSFETFFISNRLTLVSTGHRLSPNISGINGFHLSNQGQYTAIVNQGFTYQFAVLHIAPGGEITDTGVRIPTPARHNVDFDFDSTGEWFLTGQQNTDEVELALYHIDLGGNVSLWDTLVGSPIGQVWDNRLWPDLRGVAVAGGTGPVTVGLNASMEFESIIDTQTPAEGDPNAVAISTDGRMILVDDQAPGFDFPLYSYFLSEDGHMTPTGYHLSRPAQHADLRFIPDSTPVSLAGDANVDGVVDAADIVFLVNEAMPDDRPILLPPNFANADLDQDVDVDQDDLEALVAMLVGEMP